MSDEYWKAEFTKAADLAKRALEALVYLQGRYDYHYPSNQFLSDWSPISITMLEDEFAGLTSEAKKHGDRR